MKKIANKRVKYDYELDESLLAGIVLKGSEVRSIRSGRVSLKGAYINIKDNQLWLHNLKIIPLDNQSQTDQNKAHKLLVTKKQLHKLKRLDKNKVMVPLKIVIGKYIKIDFATGWGRKKYDKREMLKKNQQERDAKRELKL